MTGAGSVYGEALYELARSEKLSEELLSELSALDDSFRQEPAFLRLLSAHNLSKQERCAILDGCFGGKVHPFVLNFLKILTETGHIRRFSDCCIAYRERYNADNGILPVTAVTALPLSGEQTEKLTQRLTSLTGKTVRLINRVDPEVLGGVRLDYDGKRLDDTLSHRLRSVRERLKSTVL